MAKHARFPLLVASFPTIARYCDSDALNTAAFKWGGSEHGPGLQQVLPDFEQYLKAGGDLKGRSANAWLLNFCGRGGDKADRHAVGISMLERMGESRESSKATAKVLAVKRGADARAEFQALFTAWKSAQDAAPKTRPHKGRTDKAQ